MTYGERVHDFAGMTKRIPAETAAERGESPGEAAGLRGAKARRRRRLAGKSRDGCVRPGDKQGDAKRLRSTRRETNAGPQASRAGSRSCEARPPGLAKPRNKTRRGLRQGQRKPKACGAARENKRGQCIGLRKRRFPEQARRPAVPERSEGAKGLRSPRSKTRGAGAVRKHGAGGAKKAEFSG